MKHSEFAKDYFGQRVSVDAKYFRAHNGSKRTWTKIPTKPRLGILIGIRYLMNGRVSWYEDHSEWEPEGDSIPAWLVVYDHNTNPVYVPVGNLYALRDVTD